MKEIMEKEKNLNDDIIINNSVWKFFNVVPDGVAVINDKNDPRNLRPNPPPLVYIDENGIHQYNKPAFSLISSKAFPKGYNYPNIEDFNFLEDNLEYDTDVLKEYDEVWHRTSDTGKDCFNLWGDEETNGYGLNPLLLFKEYIGGTPKETARLTIVEWDDKRLFLGTKDTNVTNTKYFKWHPDNNVEFDNDSEFEYLNSYHPLVSLKNWEDGLLCSKYLLRSRYAGPAINIDIISHFDDVEFYLKTKDRKYRDYKILGFYNCYFALTSPQVLIYNPTEYENIPDSEKKDYIIDLISKQIEGTFTVTGKTKKTKKIDLNYLKDEFNQLIQEPDDYGYIVDLNTENDDIRVSLTVGSYDDGSTLWISELSIQSKHDNDDSDNDDSVYLIEEGIETREEALNIGLEYYNKALEMGLKEKNP